MASTIREVARSGVMTTTTLPIVTLGDIYISDPTKVALDVWRYKVEDGVKTPYVLREKGREGCDVVADLCYEARELLEEVEYADLAYTYGRQEDGSRDPHAEVPPARQIACYAVTGANEGHYVHVDLHTVDNETVPLMLVKTFMGMDHAWKIAIKLADLLDA